MSGSQKCGEVKEDSQSEETGTAPGLGRRAMPYLPNACNERDHKLLANETCMYIQGWDGMD